MFFFQTGNLFRVTDPTGNNPVNQCRTKCTLVIDVIFKTVLQSPLVNILVHTAEKLLAVVVNKLA